MDVRERRPLDLLVADTHGIVTTPELHAAGYDESRIRRLVQRRSLIRLRRGVFAVGHRAFGDDARRMAAVRSAGEGAALTGISAGRCWRITERTEQVVDVVIPGTRRPVDDARLTIDRELPAEAFATVRGMPIVTPSWTIANLATGMEPGELARVLREASYRKRLDVPSLLAITEQGQRPGVVVLRRALDLRMSGCDGYGSRLEASVDRYLRRRLAMSPRPNLLIDVPGDRLRVDLVWPALRVCLEVDGPIHDDPDVQREDHRRTLLLEAAGWTVVRIHWRDWEADRAAATEPILEMAALRAAMLST